MQQISDLITSSIAGSGIPLHSFPLCHPLQIPSSIPHTQHIDWASLLTGIGLYHNGDTNPEPPTLSLDASEMAYICQTGPHALSYTFDIDSIIFTPTNLGVFKTSVEWSFMPPFSRGIQRNQRIYIPSLNIMKDKCLFLCQDGRYECVIFFPSFPESYITEQNHQAKSATQHLDNYALSIWTNKVVLPAFDASCDFNRRQHYPVSFEQIHTKSLIKSENLKGNQLHTRVDVRIPVPASMLSKLWDKILELSDNVTGTQLPPDAFRTPILMISNHNTKLIFRQENFHSMRNEWMRDYEQRWNVQYINLQYYWLDFALEASPKHQGTTILRKSACNREWAEEFGHLSAGTTRTKVTHFTWAGTDAGSVTVETGITNSHNIAGITLCKGYNVIKEQFATAIKDSQLFGNRWFEAFGYTPALLETKISQSQNINYKSILYRDLLKQWNQTKKRLSAALVGIQADEASYGDRREFRSTLELFLHIPETAFNTDNEDNTLGQGYHRPFWILPTSEVNAFRAAECNRWILCMESIIKSTHVRNRDYSVSVEEQVRNTVMSTSLARTLRFSLGCMNPQQMPSIWEGKRWSRGRRSASMSEKKQTKSKNKRQGLNYKKSVQEYGMIWMSHKIGIWSLDVPCLRISKYPFLDIRHNIVDSHISTKSFVSSREREGMFREYIKRTISRATTENMDFSGNVWGQIFFTLSQLCVQTYNIWVWDLVYKRWCKHAGYKKGRGARKTFEREAKLSIRAIDGLEVLCYNTIWKYIGENLGVQSILDARVKEGNSTFRAWDSGLWIDRVGVLFNPEHSNPVWMHQTTYTKRILEFEEMLKGVVGENLMGTCCKRFRAMLKKVAGSYIQAILHYDRHSPSTMSKAEGRNGKLSDFQRTKWMFPKLRKIDIEEIERRKMEAGKSFSGQVTLMTDTRSREMIRGWRVFTHHDVGILHNSRALMRDAASIGMWPERGLLNAEEIIEEFEEEREDEEGSSEDSEDSNWPTCEWEMDGGWTSEESTSNSGTINSDIDDTYRM